LQQFNELVDDFPLSLDACKNTASVLRAGEDAGSLTVEAHNCWILPSITGRDTILSSGGDAGTGMVSTDCVAVQTCNISAGTSIFAMAVLEGSLSRQYEVIDMVTTPSGKPVAMVHGTTAQLISMPGSLFKEFSELAGLRLITTPLYEILFTSAISGDFRLRRVDVL
jgi:sugar (pentulose or hexulose) kinase